VASLAAAADDGSGITGVAPEAEILPVKVVVSEGFYFNKWLIDGLRHAIDAKPDVINLSLGGSELTPIIFGQPEEDPHAIDPLIEEAWDKGIVIVAAGGNTHEPQCIFPARSPKALCVAGTDRDGLPSDFSAMPNGDGIGNGVRAPSGADAKADVNGCAEWIVHAWWPRSGGNCEVGSPAYGMGFGTSYGAPHVAGLAVLLKQAGLSNEQIVERIRMTASNKGASDPVMGYGLIDADAATEGLEPLPPGQIGKPGPNPHKPSTKPRTAERSAACRAARKGAQRATRRAVAAKRAVRRKPTRARKQTLSRRLKARDRAVRRVAKRCR
jgi:subtilisin family serine protease